MKTRTFIHTTALLIAALAMVGPFTANSAETESKSKSKAAASTETKKSEAKKSETKKTESKKSESTTKSKAGDAESGTKGKGDSAEIKRAEEVLKSLDTSKKAALTKFLNSAPKAELTTLPGIGDVLADAIIKARPLESAAHLVTVDGVGEKTFADIVKSRK